MCRITFSLWHKSYSFSFSFISTYEGIEYANSGHSPSQSPTDKEKIAVDALTGQLFAKAPEMTNGEAASGSESNYGNSSEEDEDSTMVLFWFQKFFFDENSLC